MGAITNGTNDQITSPTPFGHAMRQNFLFENKWINLNHGSFGACPVPVHNAKRGYTKLKLAAPDKFLRYQYSDLLKNAREVAAELLHAPSDEVVFVPNATTGLNTILRNLTYREKDVVIYFDTIYGGIEKTLASIAETNPQLTLRKVGLGQEGAYTLPMTHAEICSAFSQTISRLLYEGYNVKAAVIDTIVSIPAVRFPFERLVKMCKEYGILSIVDGAHGVGQIPLNLAALDADFFVSNCHKWLYTPVACAVFHVPKRNQHLIRTTYPTSHGYIPPASANIRSVLPPSKTSDFVHLFDFVATTDSTSYYCVPAAMNFRRNMCGGEQAIYDYIRDNAQQGADVLAKVLGTEVMDDIDPQGEQASMTNDQGPRRWAGGIRDCAMANVLLPLRIEGPPSTGTVSRVSCPPTASSVVTIQKQDVTTVRLWMEETLVHQFHTFVPIFEYQGRMWTRISGQIYLERQDFEWLGGVLQELCARVGAGEATAATEAEPVTKTGSVKVFELEMMAQQLEEGRA